MSNKRSLNIIVVEGGDQVGKGTALNNLIEYLSKNGIETMPMAFPHYGTAIGASIRKLLKTGYIEETQLSEVDKLRVKCSLYVLDRLVFANYLLQKEYLPLVILDRGPYSNCVSLAYDLFHNEKGIDDMTRDRLINLLDLERFFIKTFNTGNCTIRLHMTGEQWKPQRSDGDDINEVADVQMLSNQVYEICGEYVGEGWLDVVTKNAGVWRSHDEILEEIVSFVRERIPNLEFKKHREEVQYVGIEELSRSFDSNLTNIPYAGELDKALQENYKEDIYKYGQLTGNYLASETEDIKWVNDEIARAVVDLYNEVGSLEKTLNDLCGYEYGSKLLNAAKNR